jgi:hypothetical protein
MIVVEGPDGAGKTTLCEAICRRYRLKMGQRSTHDRDKIWRTTRKDTWYALHEEMRCDHPPLVWDRLGPYSDPVYAPLGIPVPRPVAFTAAELSMIDVFLRHFGVVILCMPPLDVIERNVQSARQLEKVEDKLAEIVDGYTQVMPYYPRYDYTSPDNKRLDRMIEHYLRKRKGRELLASGSGYLQSVPRSRA